MEQNLILGSDLQLEDLTVTGQLRLITQNKERYIELATQSEYPAVWKEVVTYDKVTHELLFKLLQNIIKEDTVKKASISVVVDYVETILNHSKFVMSDDVRRMLLKSNQQEICYFAIDGEDVSTEFLKEVLISIAQNEECDDEEFWETTIEKIGEEYEFDEEFLKKISESENDSALRFVIERTKSIETLRYILKEEVKRANEDEEHYDHYYDEECVIWNIINSEIFEFDDEIENLMMTCRIWQMRYAIAKRRQTSTEKLNKMLISEITNDEFDNVDIISTILCHENFKMDETTRKIASKCDDWEVRSEVARDNDTTEEMLLDMYEREISNFKDSDTIMAIDIALSKKIETNGKVKLSTFQKIKITKILKESRTEKLTTTSYILEKILNVMG